MDAHYPLSKSGEDPSCPFFGETGFGLMTLIGLLALLSVGLAVFPTSLVRIWDRDDQELETRHLDLIGKGIVTYIRQNKAFPPSLGTLSPDYVAFSLNQITRNARGFPRYYAVHPSMAGFQNSTGLTVGELVNARFLLISDLGQDAAPIITTPAEFEAWWSIDESTIPNLLLRRENIGNFFYSLSIMPKGNGASFSIHNQPTDSNGGLLPSHNGFHLIGTQIAFDEDNTYVTPDIMFAITTNAAYWFDPLCVANKRWNPLNPPC